MLRQDGFGLWGSKFAIYGSDHFTDKQLSKNILAQPDEVSMYKEIDELVSFLTLNKESFAFFSAEDEVYVNYLYMRGFKIDDNEIYYKFFDNLKKYINDGYKYARATILAVVKTESDYFGKVANKEGMRKRNKIAQGFMDENDQIVYPSIRNFKNSNSAACVEFASVAHNLFLLAGLKSNFVISKDVKMKNESNNDGHAFVLVDNKAGKPLLFDMTMNKIELIDQTIIDDVFNGKPLMIGENCYANASKKIFDNNLQ